MLDPPKVFLLEARFGCEGLLCCCALEEPLDESVFCLTSVLLFATVVEVLLELVVLLELAIFGA